MDRDLNRNQLVSMQAYHHFTSQAWVLLSLSTVLIVRFMDLQVVCLPYVRLINCRFLPFRSSASFFSSQYLLLFLKSSRSSVLLLPTPFTSVICPSMAPWRRQFLLKIWSIQLAILRRILLVLRGVLFSPYVHLLLL